MYSQETWKFYIYQNKKVVLMSEGILYSFSEIYMHRDMLRRDKIRFFIFGDSRL